MVSATGSQTKDPAPFYADPHTSLMCTH